MWNFPLFPPQASSMAPSVDYAFFATMLIAVMFTTSVCLTIIAFALRYRRGSRADRSPPLV